MSKSATSDNSSAVGLFPFLAVLLCTMGALLVLLVILAQRVGTEPLVAAVTPPAETDSVSEPPADPNEAARLKVELARTRVYRQKLDELEKQGSERLEEEQYRLSHLEEHIRRMEHELAELSLVVDQLKSTEENQAVDQEQAQRELQRLQQLIKDTEVQLEDMREMAAGERSYAVVPFKGKNGTYAQPIYIVCDEHGITLEPEGLRFQPTDFIDPRWPGNPLAASLRASREYLKEKARRAGQQEPLDPYPLIIVRPSGIKYYRIAREAISSWDASFGYEFIDKDWKLSYPELPDPKLAEVQQHSVTIARERLSRLAMAAPSKFRGIAGMGGRGGPGGSGNGYGLGGSSSGGRYASSGDGIGEHAGDAQGDSFLGAGSSGSGEIGTGASGTGGGQQAFSSIGPYGGQPGEAGDGGEGGASGASGDQQLAGGGGGTQGGQDGTGGDANSQAITYPGGAQGGGANSSAGAGQPGQAGGTATSSQGLGQSTAQTANSNGSSSSSSFSARQTSSSRFAGSPSDQAEAQAGIPSLQFSKQQSIADARGSDWAIKQAMNNAVPIRRPIQVVVREDQIALLPSRHTRRGAGATGTVISLNQPLQHISDEFAGALKERVEEWGLAGNGLYWKPVLELHVGPEAGRTADRLVRLLKNSGVDVRLPETANSQRGPAAHESK